MHNFLMTDLSPLVSVETSASHDEEEGTISSLDRVPLGAREEIGFKRCAGHMLHVHTSPYSIPHRNMDHVSKS